MERQQLVIDLVERERELRHGEALREAPVIASRLAAEGLSGPVALHQIKDGGVGTIDRIIHARIDAEVKVTLPTEAVSDWQRRVEDGVEQEVRREIAWLGKHLKRYAGTLPSNEWASFSKELERLADDRIRFFKREVRIAAASSDVTHMLPWPPSPSLPGAAEKAPVTDMLFSRAILERDPPMLVGRPDQLPIGFLVGDIDYFKSFNDKYGHPKGDSVLRLVGGVLNSVVGMRGRVYRQGGEEFAILLPNHTEAEAALLAERARQSLASMSVEGVMEKVTISFGAAAYPDCSTLETLVASADRALYVSKAAGRDRVTRASAAAVESTEETTDPVSAGEGTGAAEAQDDYGDAERRISKHCASEWPNDFRMQKYCLDQQLEALRELRQGAPPDIPPKVFAQIRSYCESQYPEDYRMRHYCEQQQTRAYRELQGQHPSVEARPALKVTLRRENASPLTSERHDYLLVVEGENSTNERIEKWTLELRMPKAVVDKVGSLSHFRVPTKDTATHYCFRTTEEGRSPLQPDQGTLLLTMPYFMDTATYRRKDVLALPIEAALYAGGQKAPTAKSVEELIIF